MGDAGSNSLGALLGLAACYALALPFRLVLLAFLICFTSWLNVSPSPK